MCAAFTVSSKSRLLPFRSSVVCLHKQKNEREDGGEVRNRPRLFTELIRKRVALTLSPNA